MTLVDADDRPHIERECGRFLLKIFAIFKADVGKKEAAARRSANSLATGRRCMARGSRIVRSADGPTQMRPS